MKKSFARLNFIVFLILPIFIVSCKKTVVTNSPIDDTVAQECNGQFFSKLNFDVKPGSEIIEIGNGIYFVNNTDCISKLDSAGQVVSQRYFDYPISYIDKLNDGSILICFDYQYDGSTFKFEKTDTSFNPIWSFVSDFKFVLTTNDNGCIVGYEKINGERSNITKYSENGNKLWDFNLDIVVNDMIEVDNYEFVVGGYEYKSQEYKPCLMRVDSTGLIIWKKLYVEIFEDVFGITDVVQLSAGNFVCLLDAEKSSKAINFFGADNTGKELWKKSLEEDVEYNGIVLNGSQFIICTKEFFDETRYDIVLTNYNANSGVVWQNKYGGTGYEELNDLKIGNNNSIIISASSTNFSYTDKETNITESMYIIKTDNNGNTCY